MPMYLFRDAAGETAEAFYAMRDAPRIGEAAEIDGRRMTRIAHPHRSPTPWRGYVSRRLPRHMDGVPCTPDGKPVIETRKQEREIMARFGYERE